MSTSDVSAPFTELWLDGPLSTRFYTRLYTPPARTPPRAIVVFVHGYIDHVSHYTDAHATWAARGIAVFAFDQRGFGKTALGEKKSLHSKYGRTGGGLERMADLEWAVKEARARVDAVPAFLMGFSMVRTCHYCVFTLLSGNPKGGGLVLDFASRTTSPPSNGTAALLSGVIASSPLILLVRPPPRFLQLILTWASKVFPNMPWYTPVEAEARLATSLHWLVP
jgi:acylglycerol lipase